MIVFGSHKYGWVDQVEGLGTVATSFFHIMYVPLIPFATHLMIDDNRGLPLPMSLKSVIVAYVRAMLFWSFAFTLVLVPFSYGISCVLALPLGVAYFGMPMVVRKASDARANELKLMVMGAVAQHQDDGPPPQHPLEEEEGFSRFKRSED